MGKAQRKVRNQFTMAEKLLVLQMTEKKESQRKIAVTFGISKTRQFKSSTDTAEQRKFERKCRVRFA